jgi:hypothetical protein
MLKHVLAGAAAFALIAGAGFAQAQETTEKDKTVIQNPDGSQTVDKSKTERSVDDDGSANTERHEKSITTDPFGHKDVTEKNTETDRDSEGNVHRETETDRDHD